MRRRAGRVSGSCWRWRDRRGLAWKRIEALWPLLLLWIPLPFYVALGRLWRGAIYVPVWWPFSYYNVRYGLELLPGVRGVCGAGSSTSLSSWRDVAPQSLAAATGLIFVAASYASIWRNPVCLQRSLDQLPRPHRRGTRTGRLPEGSAPGLQLAHVSGQPCRGAAAGGRAAATE